MADDFRFRPPVENAPDMPGADELPERGEPEAALSDWPEQHRPSQTPAGEDDGPKIGFLAELLGLKRRDVLAARVAALNRAIDADPDAPVNYVLRGELRLKLREREAAAADFQKALALADSAFAASDWGLVAQTLRDRALAGLRRAGYHLRV
jgi:tetratricopeptide (TPR) repeat protein